MTTSTTSTNSAVDLLSPEAVARRRTAVRRASQATLARRRVFGHVARIACYVALVIGGGVTLPTSLLANGTTLGSAIVNYFGDASGIQKSAVIGLVVVLLAFTAIVNVGGQLLLRQRATKAPSFTDTAELELAAEGTPT